jgi:hypothetical protein
MHHIIGGFILGAAFGKTTRTTIWRPLLRGVIKGGLLAAREAKSMTDAVRSEASAIYTEAKSELDSSESQSAPSSGPASSRTRRSVKKED